MKTMPPNDFGKKYLVEQCQEIRMADLVKRVKSKLKKALLQSEIEIEDLNVRLSDSSTGFGGTRFWFLCPLCSKRIEVLYRHPVSQILGCRKCLNLDYRKHRYSKMIENKL